MNKLNECLLLGLLPVIIRTFSEKTVVYLSAGGTETILICPDSMPAEAADLVSTGAGEEVGVINFQWFHTQRALHRAVPHLGVPGHPTISNYWIRQLSQTGQGQEELQTLEQRQRDKSTRCKIRGSATCSFQILIILTTPKQKC